MKHLTVDEMIDFVSLTELNADALMLSATVNGHIRQCEQCLNHVRAFQMIHDEFSRIKRSGDFKEFLKAKVQQAPRLNVAGPEPSACDEIEGH